MNGLLGAKGTGPTSAAVRVYYAICFSVNAEAFFEPDPGAAGS